MLVTQAALRSCLQISMNTKVDHIAIMCVVGKGQAIAPTADCA
jgi:hypothetical protein